MAMTKLHPLKTIPDSTHFALLSLLLFISTTAVAGTCAPSSCGVLTNISHPFRLQTDPKGCGKYEILCDSNRTAMLQLDEGEYYYIVKIFYESRTIQVVDPAFAKSSTCSLPLQPALPSKSWPGNSKNGLYYTSSEFVSFVHCKRLIENDEYLRVPCLSQSDRFVYATSNPVVYGLSPSCGVLNMTAIYNGIGQRLSNANIFKLLHEGFNLTWSFKPRSKYQRICDCLEKARYWNTDDSLEYHKLFYLIRYPLMFEVYFSACLRGLLCENDSRCSMVYYYTMALMVSLDIAAFLLACRILGQFIFAPLSIFAFLAHDFWKIHKPVDDVEKFLRNQQTLAPVRFVYTDIITITSNFKEKLGQGGFGTIFKGKLPSGYLVAVKLLSDPKFSGEDFINEVSTIGTIHHVNVVQLVGFCSDGSKRALVYEFMPNGSLDKYICSANGAIQRPFSWDKLNDIAIGVAKGIDYLHRGCEKQILHFDIKPHNILLDHNFTPKISDFGLAKLYPKDYSLVSISVARGTIGYIAPELVSRNFGVISDKLDVYSFGMLLLELAGGRRNVNLEAEKPSQIYYPSWIYDRLNENKGNEINEMNEVASGIEEMIASQIGEEERKLAMVGLWCIQMKPPNRPSMSKVVEMLEASADTLTMPPKPFFSSGKPSPVHFSCLDSSVSELSIILEHE